MKKSELPIYSEKGQDSFAKILNPDLLAGVNIEGINDQSFLTRILSETYDRRRTDLLTTAAFVLSDWSNHNPVKTEVGEEVVLWGYKPSGFYEFRVEVADRRNLAEDEVNNVKISIVNQPNETAVSDETHACYSPHKLRSLISAKVFDHPVVETVDLRKGILQVFNRNLVRTTYFKDGARLVTSLNPRIFKQDRYNRYNPDTETGYSEKSDEDIHIVYNQSPANVKYQGSNLSKFYISQAPDNQIDLFTVYSNISTQNTPSLINGVYLHYTFQKGKGILKVPQKVLTGKVSPETGYLKSEDILNRQKTQLMDLLLQILPEEISLNQVIGNLGANRLPLDGTWNPFSQ